MLYEIRKHNFFILFPWSLFCWLKYVHPSEQEERQLRKADEVVGKCACSLLLPFALSVN
jgi:hypothetical protein